jgi:hypothetical protein
MGESPLQEAILVLGMHRSGTSALTRVLNLVGCDISSDLRPPLPANNESGFWEPFDISLIHDEMLVSAGSSWDDVLDFPGYWFRTDVSYHYQERIADILNWDFADSARFVLKDPRICRLVPFWLRLLAEIGRSPRFVLIFRNPLEVAQSLQARDRLPVSRSLLLWLKHILASERDSREYPRSVVTYSSLLQDWRSTTAKIAQDLDIQWPQTSPQTAVEIDEFLSPSLKHHHASVQDLTGHGDVIEWIIRAFELMSVAERNDSLAVRRDFDEIQAEVEKAELAYGPIIVHGRQLRRERGSSYGLTQSPVRQATAELSGAQGEQQSARECTMSRLTMRLGLLTSEIGELSEALAEAEHLAAKLGRESLRHQGRASRLELQISKHSRLIAQLEKELARSREALAAARGQQCRGHGRQATEIAGQLERIGQLTASLKYWDSKYK